MKWNASGKLYGLIMVAILLLGCFLGYSSRSKGDGAKEFSLVANAKESFVYNASGNYFIQLVPRDAKIGHMVVFEAICSERQKEEKDGEDSLIVSAYLHKFNARQCDFKVFEVYQSAESNELYSIQKETHGCALRHEQRGYLEFADE